MAACLVWPSPLHIWHTSIILLLLQDQPGSPGRHPQGSGHLLAPTHVSAADTAAGIGAASGASTVMEALPQQEVSSPGAATEAPSKEADLSGLPRGATLSATHQQGSDPHLRLAAEQAEVLSAAHEALHIHAEPLVSVAAESKRLSGTPMDEALNIPMPSRHAALAGELAAKGSSSASALHRPASRISRQHSSSRTQLDQPEPSQIGGPLLAVQNV